jgi:hypothetical protein
MVLKSIHIQDHRSFRVDSGKARVSRSRGPSQYLATAFNEGEDVFVLGPWDIDGDGTILRNEFEEGLRGWGTFAEFDADLNGFIRPEEFAASVFFRYDADGAGFLEEPELSDIGDDMGDDGFWDM